MSVQVGVCARRESAKAWAEIMNRQEQGRGLGKKIVHRSQFLR